MINNWVRIKSGYGPSVEEIYKDRIGSYAKFYKMDPLSRLGFVASELLLDAEGSRDREWGETRGVVLMNATSSLADDRNYQRTIVGDDAFPSPSLFVYTLPNVVTGEIAIRNRYYGETNFFVLPGADPEQMSKVIEMSFCDDKLQSLLTGWIDCEDEEHYDALMFIANRTVCGRRAELAEEIAALFEKEIKY
ncbi:MAG: hypothetical protein J6X58_06855 [Bacteroidales bacterium]|nr:hypothetical protein [Bacteroidales bacterium]